MKALNLGIFVVFQGRLIIESKKAGLDFYDTEYAFTLVKVWGNSSPLYTLKPLRYRFHLF